MKHTAMTLTAEVLTEMFGDSCDWYSVLKNGKRVGTFSDLRAKVLKKQALSDAKEKKKFHDVVLKQQSVKETFEFLSDVAPENAKVFMNQTQPNIHMNGHKVYIVCGPVKAIRMSITHKTLSFEEMAEVVESLGYKCQSGSYKNHISISSIMPENVFNILNLLCGE